MKMLWVKTAAGVLALMPSEWTTEMLPGVRMRITNGSGGAATVDFRCRVFLGYAGHGRTPTEFINGDRYIGRNWRERLIADAVEWLQGAS